MNCDADPLGSIEELVIDAGDPPELSRKGHPIFGASDGEFPRGSPSGSPVSRRDSEESSLIEESWISNQGGMENRQSLEYRLMAREYEGLRMGRELHDSTSQLLLSLRFSLAHLKHAYEVGESEEALEEISETVRQIEQEIRAFSYLHYPAELGRGGLVAALDTLARGFTDRTGLKIMFKAECDRVITNGAASIALLRVAQEALMNVHRHAGAELVRMSLAEQGGSVELSVQDDGIGLPSASSEAVSKGLGLPGMRHRVERLGGQFLVKRLKHGTKLVARLAIRRCRPQARVEPDRGKPKYAYHGS